MLQIYKGLHPVLMLPDLDRCEASQVLLHLRKLGMVKSKDQALIIRHRSATKDIDISIELNTV